MKYIIFLLFCVTTYVRSDAQDPQQLTFTPDNGKTLPKNPQLKKDFNLATPIIVQLLSRNLSRLQKIEIQDLSSTVKITLSPTDIGVGSTTQSASFTIDKDSTIHSFASRGKVPYPMNIVFTLRSPDTTISTGTIGQLAILADANPGKSTPASPLNGNAYTNIAYYDALTLQKLLKSGETKKLLDFLNTADYYKGKVKSAADLKTAIKGNTFLEEAFKDIINSADKAAPNIENDKANGQSNFLALTAASIGSTDITNLADGFAKFLVKRTKQELSVTFFDRFNQFISKPQYQDIRTLFPQTYATLQVIGNEIYNYEAYINSLRESFQQDLNGLLPHLRTVVETGQFSDNLSKEIQAICFVVLDVSQDLLAKKNAGQILADFNTSDLNGFKDANGNNDVLATVQTLKAFSQSIRSLASTRYWVSADSLQLLMRDNTSFKIFMGLLATQTSNIKYATAAGGAISLYELLNNNAAALDKYQVFLNGLVQKTTAVTQNIQNMTGKDKDKLTFTDYYTLYSSSLDFLVFASDVNTLPGLENLITAATKAKITKYLNTARTAGNIALDISRQNFSSAIINTLQVYSLVTEGQAGATALRQDLLKFGSFMAAIVQAQNSDDVAAAIEAAALPSGSARIKRESQWNIALNAYVGPYFGKEKIKGIDSANKWNATGITAPIGVSFSRGGIKCNKKNGGKSFSVFLSVFDLGAITAFRFTNDSAQKIPEIQLKDIISPGVFLSYGFGRCPISLNLGYQYGPLLRKVALDANKYSNYYTRLSVSLCVDLPLLNFYTKSL